MSHARPFAQVRRHERLRWWADLVVEFAVLLFCFLAVIAAMSMVPLR